MKKRTQKSEKKTKFLLLLIVLTAILSITATYAWFSTQRDVEITGMRLNVEVAESMQISLDGETWVQSITISDMKQFYGTATDTTLHQAVKVGDGTNTNYVPTELLPVSSVGTTESGIMKFVQGTVSTTAAGKTTLTSIEACDETTTVATGKTVAERQGGNEDHPYLVFDMYLRNISAAAAGTLDTLYLNEESKVWVDAGNTVYEGAGVAGTGLEYSARVGLVKYGNTVAVTATDIEGGDTVGEQVRKITSSTDDQVAIWEPNDLNHTPYVVSNNGMGITQESQAVTTLAIKDTVTTDIEDVYDATDTTNLKAVRTFKPAYDADGLTAYDEIETLSHTAETADYMGLAPNAISKVRVYVWLEGQDPDCIDMASTGDKLNINLRFWRDANSKGNITYDTTATPTEPEGEEETP